MILSQESGWVIDSFSQKNHANVWKLLLNRSFEETLSCLFYIFLFQITSQNPYAEVFVGRPLVQTVDIKNLTEVEEALRDIINTKVVTLILLLTKRTDSAWF